MNARHELAGRGLNPATFMPRVTYNLYAESKAEMD